MNSWNTLNCAVSNWAIEKGIFDNSDSKTQCLKFLSEAGEVADAVAKGNKEEIEDGIGDVLVTLILLLGMEMPDITLEDCLKTAYYVISKRTGKMQNGVFVKDES